MLTFLSHIRLKHIGIIVFVLLLGYAHFITVQYTKQVSETKRNAENFENALTIDSLENRIFSIKSESELNQLLEANQELQDLLAKTDVKKKRIQKLYYQQQKYIDSVKSRKDVSGLVEKIRKDIPAVKKWRDSTACLTIDGTVEYKNDSLHVSVDKREKKDEVVLVHSKGRRKPIKWLANLRLGPREDKFDVQSKCSDVKVTVIEKQK